MNNGFDLKVGQWIYCTFQIFGPPKIIQGSLHPSDARTGWRLHKSRSLPHRYLRKNSTHTLPGDSVTQVVLYKLHPTSAEELGSLCIVLPWQAWTTMAQMGIQWVYCTTTTWNIFSSKPTLRWLTAAALQTLAGWTACHSLAELMLKISDKHLGVKPIKPSTPRIDHLSTSFITGFQPSSMKLWADSNHPSISFPTQGWQTHIQPYPPTQPHHCRCCPRQRTSPGDYFARNDTSAVNAYLNWWLMTRLSFVCLVIWLEQGLAILHIHHQICEPHPESVVKLSFYVCHDSSCFIRFHNYHHHHHHQSSIIFIASIISNLHHHYETATIFWKVSLSPKVSPSQAFVSVHCTTFDSLS